ncbi:MAG: hypothetical protein BWK80_27310 [Desulfobacteraceae bacterium IS3]|nr:MAG: hypothetical protein BWK80_27310 [Desulfobacteraceae bacterium IS3]
MAKANRSNRRKDDKFPSLTAQKKRKSDWEHFNFLENMLIFCTVPERRVPEESGVHFSLTSSPDDKALTILFRTDRKEDPLIREKNVKRPDYMVLYIKEKICLCTIIEMKGTDHKKLKRGIEQINVLKNRLRQEMRRYLPAKWQVEIQGLLLTPPNSQIPLKQLELLKEEIIILPLQYSHKFELFQYISKKNEKLSEKYSHAPRRKNDLNFIEKLICNQVLSERIKDAFYEKHAGEIKEKSIYINFAGTDKKNAYAVLFAKNTEAVIAVREDGDRFAKRIQSELKQIGIRNKIDGFDKIE